MDHIHCPVNDLRLSTRNTLAWTALQHTHRAIDIPVGRVSSVHREKQPWWSKRTPLRLKTVWTYDSGWIQKWRSVSPVTWCDAWESWRIYKSFWIYTWIYIKWRKSGPATTGRALFLENECVSQWMCYPDTFIKGGEQKKNRSGEMDDALKTSLRSAFSACQSAAHAKHQWI